MAEGRRVVLGVVLIGIALGATLGCGPRYSRVVAQDDGKVKVTLRAQKQRGAPIDRGFSHPAVISGVRLAHILSAIQIRSNSGDEARGPAIPTPLLFPVGDAASKALARADATQEVVVQAVRVERSLGIFTEKRLTSLVLWARDEDLYVHVGHVDRVFGKGKNAKMPEPFPSKASRSFRVIASRGVVPAAPQTVAVRWRDPRFRKPSHVRVAPGGRVERRTILLESPEITEDAEDAEVSAGPSLPDDLSPDTLRELADLEEARRAGRMSEAEYGARRRELLDREAPRGP